MNISVVGSKERSRHMRGFLVITILALVMLLFPVSAKAGGLLHASTIPVGQVIENDVFLTGETPVVNGTVNGNVFIVGSEAIISGEVNGSVFIVAQNIRIPGNITGSLYAVAVEISLQDGGQIERNLNALTVSLVTEKDSAIGRNLSTLALSGRLQGQTEGDTIALIGPFEIFKLLRDAIDQNITGVKPPQSSSANIDQLYYLASASSPHKALIRVDKPANRSPLVDWLITTLQSLLGILIVGGLTMWIFPRQFQSWADRIQKKPLASTGSGLIVLINGYIAPLLALFILVGLLLGMIYLSLSSLAWMTFWAGLGTLVSLFSLFQIAVTYLSKAIVSFVVGAFFLSRVARGTLKYRIVPLLLGLLIYMPLATIPYMGTIMGLAVTSLGLGAIWAVWRQSHQHAEPVDQVIKDKE